MRSISATDVPPNFITRRAIWDLWQRSPASGPIHSGAVAAPQLAEAVGFHALIAGTCSVLTIGRTARARNFKPVALDFGNAGRDRGVPLSCHPSLLLVPHVSRHNGRY